MSKLPEKIDLGNGDFIVKLRFLKEETLTHLGVSSLEDLKDENGVISDKYKRRYRYLVQTKYGKVILNNAQIDRVRSGESRIIDSVDSVERAFPDKVLELLDESDLDEWIEESRPGTNQVNIMVRFQYATELLKSRWHKLHEEK